MGFRAGWGPIAGPGASLLVGVEGPTVPVGHGAKPRADYCKLGSGLLPNSLSAVTHASVASKGARLSFIVMVIKTVRTLVPCSWKLLASGRSYAAWPGPLA